MGTEDDLRGDIESALGGGDGADDGGAPATESPSPAPAPSPEPSTPPEGEPAPAPAAAAERDSLGRFLPRKAADQGGAAAPTAPPTSSPAVAGAPLPTPTPAAPPSPDIPPPPGWGPAVREHWAAVPAPVKEQIAQREQQMQRWANDTAPMRNAGQAFLHAIEPHRMTIQAEGVDPITAVVNLMQVGTTLRFGTPQEKAQQLANIAKVYSIDIGLLDSALAGVAPAPGQAPQINVQAEVQRALAPLMTMAQQRQQADIQQTTEQARTALVDFASDPKHEFIDDVRVVMADMLDVAAKQGYPLTLQDAYDRACALHPEVSKVIVARRQGSSAQQLTAAAQRAKAAAVSVRGTAPVGNPGRPEPSSIRESIEAAIESHSRI